MKKLLVVLLALTFVFVMASVTLAVVTSSVDGKVEWTYKNGEQFGGSVDGKIVFDLAKDFGEGYSAGLKIKLTPGDNVTVAPNDLDKASSVAYDGDGWIKMVKDFGTLTFQTGGLGGNAASELGGGYDMSGNAGVKFESTTLVDGLSLTMVVNDAFKDTAPDPANDGNYANYLLKGEYKNDTLTLGAGYQAHTQPVGFDATLSTENDMMAVWAGYKLSDALSFGLEYASRPNVDAVDGEGNVVTGSTAILVKADYTAGALTVGGKVLMQTGAYWTMDPDDVGTVSAWNFFKYGYDAVVNVNDDPKNGTGVQGTAIKIDAKYQLTDALSASLAVESISSGVIGVAGFDDNNGDAPIAAGSKVVDDKTMSYKLSVTDKLTEKVTLDGWYAGYGPVTELGLKASYAFVAGLDGSLEVKSNVAGEGVDSVNSYTATLKATL